MLGLLPDTWPWLRCLILLQRSGCWKHTNADSILKVGTNREPCAQFGLKWMPTEQKSQFVVMYLYIQLSKGQMQLILDPFFCHTPHNLYFSLAQQTSSEETSLFTAAICWLIKHTGAIKWKENHTTPQTGVFNSYATRSSVLTQRSRLTNNDFGT